MIQGDEEAVMSVKMDMMGAPSPFSRARSPNYMRASSLKEMEETDETICSVSLVGEDKMDGGYNIPKLEISHHISCIKIETGSPSLNSHISTIDISPPPYPHIPPHPLPTSPASSYYHHLRLSTSSRIYYGFSKSRKEEE